MIKAEAQHLWYLKHKEELCKKARQYRLDHKEACNSRARQYYHEHKEEIIPRRKRQYQELKAQVLTHYGNEKLACVRCGFDDIRALTIDHIQGHGRQHIRMLKTKSQSGSTFYVWLKSHGFPEEYQTLCANCQFIKRVVNGEHRGGEYERKGGENYA
jgi:hypothetical protein